MKNKTVSGVKISIRLLLALAVLGLMFYCLLPLLMWRVFNIGVLLPELVLLCILLIIIFWARFKKIIGWVFKRIWGKILIFLTAAGITAFAVLFIIISVNIANAARPTGESVETVIVLGAEVTDWGPSEILWGRIQKAAEYLNAHPEAVCIATGGQGENEPMTEASAIKEHLLKYGIDESRIFLEDKSTSTKENLIFAKEIMDKNGLPARAVIVTDEFHQFRAGIFAERAGIEPYSYPSVVPGFVNQAYWIREVFGVVYMFVFE